MLTKGGQMTEEQIIEHVKKDPKNKDLINRQRDINEKKKQLAEVRGMLKKIVGMQEQLES